MQDGEHSGMTCD